MTIDEKIDLIKKDTLEIIKIEELEDKLNKENPVVYTGYEPSGKIHLGHAITVAKLKQLQNMGFKVKILLADFHAYLNGKGSLEEIEELAKYNENCFNALGLDETTEFVYGSDFQTNGEYTTNVYKLSTLTTMDRARRSMDQVSRHSEHPKVANVIYPLMQVADMVALDVDIALGGMEQRKIQMLAREYLPKIGFKSPVCIHTPLLHGTDGDAKMSSSKGNFIAVDDDEKTISKKIKKAHCPMNEIKGNPVYEIAKYFVYPYNEKLLIERPEKFGGNLELTENELEDIYISGELHPMDLKTAVTKYLIEYLKPVREYFNNIK
ncbi:MAG: tyrosine--tRNA ligase [Methanobrevibacter sp.]|jgi:tyrosyl-tRNA synthetase|nr:tyrosine--tRNA ligase [Candidatus Methanoflexus mossambicus]